MKRFLSLLLIFALLCMTMVVLGSCGPDDTGDGTTPPAGGTTPPGGTTTPPDTPSTPGSIEVITDPTNPNAGGDNSDYITEK